MSVRKVEFAKVKSNAVSNMSLHVEKEFATFFRFLMIYSLTFLFEKKNAKSVF